MIDEEEFRIRLLLNKDVSVYDLRIKQFTIDDIFKLGYIQFNNMRDFVNINSNNFNREAEKSINDYMFEVKEHLMIQYPMVNYDLDYTLFDMICYMPIIEDMFKNFINTFVMGVEVDNNLFSISKIGISHNPLDDTMEIKILCSNVYMKSITLSRHDFDELMDFFSILNYSVKVDRNIIKDDEKVKEFDERIKQLREKHADKQHLNITLESILSSLIDSDNNSYTHETVSNKTIYQVMNSFNRMCKFKDHDFMNLVRVNGGDVKEKDIEKCTWYYNVY